MWRKRAGQKDRKKVGVAEGCEGRRVGQRDVKKVGVVAGWKEGERGRGM